MPYLHLFFSKIHRKRYYCVMESFFHVYYWTLGWVENACFFIKFWISQTLGENLLIHRKKGILPEFQLHWKFFRHGTPRLKITKIMKIIKFSCFLTFFLDSYEAWNKNTNKNSWYKHLWADTKKFRNLCQTGCNPVRVCVMEV